MAEVTIFVLHPNEQYCREVAAAFSSYDPEMSIEAVADLREAPNRVRDEKPAAVVVGVDTANDPALKTIETISNMPGDVGIIVVSKAPSQELLVSCMRAGSDEFLEFPIDLQELAKAMGGLFKRKGITFWLTFADKYGYPTAVGKYPPGAQPKEKDDLLEALGAIAQDRKSTRLNSSHIPLSRMPSSA